MNLMLILLFKKGHWDFGRDQGVLFSNLSRVVTWPSIWSHTDILGMDVC